MNAKRLLLRGILACGGDRVAHALTRRDGVVLMLHRIGDDDPERITPKDLRTGLAWLRRQHAYEFVPLQSFFRRDAPPLPHGRKALAISVDDGYVDQVEVMGPIFREFDVPATLFVTTGFVDGSLWMWWDRVAFVMSAARAPVALPATLPVADGSVGAVVEALKRIPDQRRREAIIEIERAAGVDVPAKPPADFAAATWDQLRSWAATGVFEFAPHTVTHPVLSRVDDAACRAEIVGSWDRLRQELAEPSPVFCFPNGKRDDFGEREMRIVREAGMLGSVSAEEGVVLRPTGGSATRDLLPRYRFPAELDHLRSCVSGLDAIRYHAFRPRSAAG